MGILLAEKYMGKVIRVVRLCDGVIKLRTALFDVAVSVIIA